MLKKCLAIFLSTALALGVLVQGSFAYFTGTPPSTPDDLIYSANSLYAPAMEQTLNEWISYGFNSGNYYYLFTQIPSGNGNYVFCVSCSCEFGYYNSRFYALEPNALWNYCYVQPNGRSNIVTESSSSGSGTQFGTDTYYLISNDSYLNIGYMMSGGCWSNFDFCLLSSSGNTTISNGNLLASAYEPDNRFMDVYISGSTYGNVRYLCVEVDDTILSSSWVSVRYTDQYGPGTYIQDYPFDFFTANGHSFIKIMPDLISDSEFTVTSVLFSGSSSWGTKEVTGLDLTFNEDVFPTPIPSAYPVPDYSYYDTTYINYNGGNPEIIYTPISSQLTIGFLGTDTSKYYFLDEYPFLYLEQPFSYTFIVIPDIQYEYSSFLGDCLYQYDVVVDDFEITNDNYYQIYSFDYIYGSGAWSNLNGLLTAAQLNDVSSILETWYASHDPIIFQFPYRSQEAFSFDDRVYDCSLIITDSFFFKQTNYLLGDTGDILSEFSERFFKIDGFSDSLFDNISSLYNLNLQYYDSSLQALTGLSYWLNDNDISSNLSDISNLLSSVDNYLSSVDGKLNYLVTIDSDLNDLLEWFQNQEDSDVILTLPDFNPSILINIYGDNVGDFVEFVQGFVNTLPQFDFSDFPNFFDYAADLVDDTAGSGDDLIGSLFNPYDYDDSGLHEFGWD